MREVDAEREALRNCLSLGREEAEKRERHVERCEGALRDREATIHDLDRQVNELRERYCQEMAAGLEREFPGRRDLPF